MLFSLYFTFVLVDIHFRVRTYIEIEAVNDADVTVVQWVVKESIVVLVVVVAVVTALICIRISLRRTIRMKGRSKRISSFVAWLSHTLKINIFCRYNRHDRNDRKGRDKDRYYHRGRGHSSESSNDSFNGWVFFYQSKESF